MTAWTCGGAVIMMPEFKARDFLALAARERLTYTVMVPAMHNLCLLQPDFDSYLLSEPQAKPIVSALGRSEEHTSELQSLMRISYAVFCLKKKKLRPNQSNIIRRQNKK